METSAIAHCMCVAYTLYVCRLWEVGRPQWGVWYVSPLLARNLASRILLLDWGL